MTPNFAPAGTQKRRKTWCGPYALAIMLGKDYDEAYPHVLVGLQLALEKEVEDEDIAPLRPNYITGMVNEHVAFIADWFGYPIEWEDAPLNDRQIRCTLKQFIPSLAPNRYYIVNVTHHYITIDMWNRLWCDNHSKEWKPLTDCKWLRKRVEFYAEYQPKWRGE